MFVLAVVEIKRGQDGTLPSDLIRLAYRASRRGCIALLLNGVQANEVDEIIDDLVTQMPLNTPGLLYVEAGNLALLGEVCRKAAMIFVSEAARRRCAASLSLRRPDVRHLHTAATVLSRVARPARIAEMTGTESV